MRGMCLQADFPIESLHADGQRIYDSWPQACIDTCHGFCLNSMRGPSGMRKIWSVTIYLALMTITQSVGREVGTPRHLRGGGPSSLNTPWARDKNIQA